MTYVLDLVSSKPRYAVNDYPGQTPSKIHDLMHGEAHDAGGKDVVLHVRVPGQP